MQSEFLKPETLVWIEENYVPKMPMSQVPDWVIDDVASGKRKMIQAKEDFLNGSKE